MKTLQYCTRLVFYISTFFMLSCTKTKDLPIDTMIKDDTYNYEAFENVCAIVNYGFDEINSLSKASRDGESIVSITRDENNKYTMSFLSGKETDFYDWHGNVLAYPFIGLSLNESGELCWVIVDNCSRADIYKIANDYRDVGIVNELIEKLYLSYGEKVPVKGEIRLEFDKKSKTFRLYEGQKLLHTYNSGDYLRLSYSSQSRNIRSFVEKDDCVEFELLDGKILTLPKFTLSLSLDVSKLAFKKGGDIHNVHYELSNVMDKATLEAKVSNGWQVSITPETSTSGTITITAPETIEETTITITAKESDRTAKCELKCGKPMFYLPQKEFKLGYEGKNLSVPVKTNLNFFIKIPDDAQTWIALVAEETTDEKIVLRVSENEEAFSRDATILCLDDEGVVWDKFSVSQNWGENKIFEVQNPEAGGLQEYIKTRNMSNVKKLKISGPLNDNDFLFLRGMRSLEYLDVYDVEAYSLPKGCFKREYYSWQCEKIILPKTLTAISEECFYCTSIKEVRIPVSCETIGASAFERCSSLNSVSFENGSGLKTISSSAFAICQSLKTITIPASCETIGASSFNGCSSLSSVIFENGSCLRTMSYSSFKGCSSLTSISIPASCETIGVSAFERCSSLSSISFESGSCLKIMSESSFRGCSSLTSISIPASCETIDAYAFRGCAITDVTYANGSALATIGTEAFAGCGNLHRIDMRNCTKLKSIGSKAFYGDNQIYSFQIGAAVPPSCPADAFDNVGEYSVLKVPSGSEDAYKAASGWGEFYKIIANE